VCGKAGPFGCDRWVRDELAVSLENAALRVPAPFSRLFCCYELGSKPERIGVSDRRRRIATMGAHVFRADDARVRVAVRIATPLWSRRASRSNSSSRSRPSMRYISSTPAP
jgi:hypothetical protein